MPVTSDSTLRAPGRGVSGRTLIGGALAALLMLAPSSAAADRKNPLDDQPAVRNRLLLVAKRLEATVLFESTINADFRHTVGAGLKLEYHVNDMFSFGAIGVFSTSIDTKLTKRVVATLEMSVDDATREPSQQEFTQRLNKIPLHGAVYASLTPWYGKLAAFGKAFVNFDFYFQGGAAFASLTSSCDTNICTDTDPLGDPTMADENPNNDLPLNSGFRPGLYLGGGLHVFVGDFIAIDLAVRDYAFKDNPSGADFFPDLAVTDKDSRFLHHLFAGVGVSVMLPFKVKRTP